MNDERRPDALLICPHCHALNPANTIICTACGVRIDTFQKGLPRLRQLQNEQTARNKDQLEHEAGEILRHETRTVRRLFTRQLLFLFAFAIVLAVAIIGMVSWVANMIHLQQAHLAQEKQQAITCIEKMDYKCAKEKLENILRQDPNHAVSRDLLNLVHFLMAKQYASAGQWQLSIQELDDLLKSQPDDQVALSLLKSVFDQWIADAASHGDRTTLEHVRSERDARFPKE
jgi:hypothetical protein